MTYNIVDFYRYLNSVVHEQKSWRYDAPDCISELTGIPDIELDKLEILFDKFEMYMVTKYNLQEN